MAVTVKFIADVVNWLSGLEKSEGAIDDNATALEDVMKKAVELGREAGYTTDKIAEDFSTAFGVPVDRAKSAIDGLVDKTDELGAAGDDAGDQMGKGISGGADTAGESLSELGQIAQDVLEGDFTSAAQGAVSALSGLAVFAGAGGALAAGIIQGVSSIVGSWVAEWEKATEESKKRADEWAQAYIEAGGKVLNSAITAGNALAIATDAGKLEEARTNAKNWGVDVGTAIAAMSGETWALAAAQDGLSTKSDEAAAALAAQETQVDNNAGAAYDLADSVNAGKDAMSQLTGEMAAGSQQAADYNSYLVNTAKYTEGATTVTDEFGDSITTLPDGKQIYIDAETGQATQDMDAIEQKIYSIPTAKVKYIVDATDVYNWHPPFKQGVVGYNPAAGTPAARFYQPLP
jgi:hypothetical protein